MKLIPFKEILDDDEFREGARFIKKETGLRKLKPEEDFFEYMLINDLGSNEWMICTHIDPYEAGSVISHVRKTTSETNRHTVSAKEFKRSNILDEDLDNWYYQYVDHDRYWTQHQNGLLARLKKIDFHDLPLNHMSINYDYQLFSIGFDIYNEDKEDYDSFILEFENVKELKSGSLFIDAEGDVEIYNFSYKFAQFLEGNFTLVFGESKASMEITFICESAKLLAV